MQNGRMKRLLFEMVFGLNVPTAWAKKNAKQNTNIHIYAVGGGDN